MADEAIKSVAGEIMSIAVEHGYEGPRGLSIAGAIDALADTLAGEDVDSGSGSIAEAVRAIAPYIGSGGGGTQYGENYAFISTNDKLPGDENFSFDDFNPRGQYSFILVDPSGEKQLNASNGGTSGGPFLDGCTLSWNFAEYPGGNYRLIEPAESCHVDAILLDARIDPQAAPTYSQYDGVTFDADSKTFTIPMHDITDNLEGTYEGSTYTEYPVIVIRTVLEEYNPYDPTPSNLSTPSTPS